MCHVFLYCGNKSATCVGGGPWSVRASCPKPLIQGGSGLRRFYVITLRRAVGTRLSAP